MIVSYFALIPIHTKCMRILPIKCPVSIPIKRTRWPPIIICLIVSAPGLIGLTFSTVYWLLLLSGFCLGFFFMSAGPVIYQYSAEVSYPSPEATSQGLLMLAGQISGIIFIFGMDLFRSESGSMTPFLIVLIVLSLINIALSFMIKESSMIGVAYQKIKTKKSERP